MAVLLVLGAAALPAREVASPQAAPTTAPCGPDFRSQLATILKLRDPGEPAVVEGSADDEQRLSLALVINDYLMLAPKVQAEGQLPRSLQGLQPAQLRQWRDTGKLVPAVCEIVAFMHAHYSGIPFTPSSNQPLAAGEGRPSAPEPRPAPSARARPDALATPDSTAVSPDSEPEDRAAEPAPDAPAPARELAQVAPQPSLPMAAPSAAARRTVTQLEELLAVPPYPTLRDMRVQNLELTRKELVARRGNALRARAELLDVLQKLGGARDEWSGVRELLGPGGVVRVEQGIKRAFSGSSVAVDRDRALRFWRGEAVP